MRKVYCVIFLVAGLVLILTSCGRVHHRVITQAEYFPELKQVKLVPTEVKSREQHKHARDINEQVRIKADDRFQGIIVSKGIEISDACESVLSCRVYVRYGNRALRYFVGYGAGAGRVSVKIELKDNQDTIIYATETTSDLAMTVGDVGGDMIPLIDKVIGQAMDKFVEKMGVGL